MKTTKMMMVALLLTVAVSFAKPKSAYVSLAGKGTTVMSENEAFVDLRGAVTFNEVWSVGLSGSAMGHNNELNQLVNDGTYHMYVNYGGLFVERSFALGRRVKLGISLMTGMGEAYYQYDHDFRQEKVWSEEIIDRTTFGVQELGLAIQYRVSNRIWLGLTGSYRNTAPVKLIGTAEDVLNTASAGIVLQYHIF